MAYLVGILTIFVFSVSVRSTIVVTLCHQEEETVTIQPNATHNSSVYIAYEGGRRSPDVKDWQDIRCNCSADITGNNVQLRYFSKDISFAWMSGTSPSLNLDFQKSHRFPEHVVISGKKSSIEITVSEMSEKSDSRLQASIAANSAFTVKCHMKVEIQTNNTITNTKSQFDYTSIEMFITVSSIAGAFLIILVGVSIALCCVMPQKHRRVVENLRKSVMMLESQHGVGAKGGHRTAGNKVGTVIYDDVDIKLRQSMGLPIDIYQGSEDELVKPSNGIYSNTRL